MNQSLNKSTLQINKQIKVKNLYQDETYARELNKHTNK